MASLLIRNVDEALHARLKDRARAHSRSLEEEARETLRIAIADDASLARPETLVQIAARFFGPKRGAVLDLPPRSADRARPPPDFAGPEFDR
jgi:plasmid stability protein